MPTKIDLKKKIEVNAGDRQAFYIAQLNDDDILWYDRSGGNVGDVDKADSYISLLVGTAKKGSSFDPFQQENIKQKGFSGGILYHSCGEMPTTSPTTSCQDTTLKFKIKQNKKKGCSYLKKKKNVNKFCKKKRKFTDGSKEFVCMKCCKTCLTCTKCGENCPSIERL
mmetsp:Transcript_39738/g.93065  ORF Transcript_39738/g.93065 Transcript_39738/m.93065 type:complete len:167 (-) Transcript_39738:176-676(-)